MSFLATAAIVGAGAQVLKGIGGLGQMRKGKRLAKANKRPMYEIPGEFQQNVAEAENDARVGMSQQQYNNTLNNVNRNQAGALRMFGKTGRAGSLASLVRAGNDATMNLDAQDAAMRATNKRFAFGQRGIMGQQRLAKQQWDKFDKYNENAQAAAALQGAGRQNAMGSLDGISKLGMSYLGAPRG